MNFLDSKGHVSDIFLLRLLIALSAICVILMISNSAFAASATAQDDVIGATLCRLVQNLTGGIAKGIATIAIFAVGGGLFVGKVNLPVVLMTAAGVGIIFGAGKLVAFISGDSAAANCPTS